MSRIDYISMSVFLLAICVMGGLFTTRRSKSPVGGEAKDHLLAGGNIPWWAAAISYVMALFSTVSLVSTPGEAYNNGLGMYVLEWFAPVTGLLFFFVFVRFYFTVRTYTPFAYLERRFDSRVRAIISGIYLFTRISILAMVLLSMARVFEGMAGWAVWKTLVVLGAVSIIYCTLGGLKAVIWTNVLQFAVMIVGISLVVYLCTRSVDGGVAGVFKYSFEHGRGFNFDKEFFSFDPHARVTFWLLMISSIWAYMFYASSDQIAIQQLLSTSSYKAAYRSFLTSVIIFIPLGAILWFLGLAVFTYFGQHPQSGVPKSGDLALFKFIAEKTPAPVPGLMASAALAAAISTVGAMIMSLATVATKDFYLRFYAPSASDTDQVKFSRWMTILLGILGTVMGIVISETSKGLRETLLESNTIWGSIITVVPPVFFLGVISRRCSALHALASIGFGLLITLGMVIWYLYSRKMENPISFLLVSAPGFLGTIAFGMIAPYLFGKPPSPEQLDNLTLFTLRKDHRDTLRDDLPEATAVAGAR